MIASFLHSHIDNSSKVNLGRALVMLSIHDIGETIVGDVITFNKTKEDNKKESDAAQEILSQDLVEYYKELEECKSLDAKFAWAVDILGPFLYELESPNMTRKRFKDLGITSKIVDDKKRTYFEWDSVLFGIFGVCISTFGDIENGKSTVFAVKPDLSDDNK
jgi:5'-deoxynucleotidase YfbR-like HD superfamily hydrolase